MASPTVPERAVISNSASDLAFAFGNLPPSKQNSGKKNKSSLAGSAADIDLRDFSQTDRELLSHGTRVLICAGDTTIIGIGKYANMSSFFVDLPRALFLATSTKPELLVNSRVSFPHDTERQGIVRVVAYLKEMIWWRQPGLSMVCSPDVFEMLSVTAAAAALGMNKYTKDIYRKCEATLRHHMPSYRDLDALKLFANAHARLLDITASQNLAIRVWEGTLPEPVMFGNYLETFPALREKIIVTVHKHEAWLQGKKEREEKHKLWAERAEKQKAATLALKAEREEREKKQAEKQKAKEAEDKAFWEKRKTEAAQDEQSIKKKLAGPVDKRKFTPRERAHWNRTRGGKLPKGC